MNQTNNFMINLSKRRSIPNYMQCLVCPHSSHVSCTDAVRLRFLYHSHDDENVNTYIHICCSLWFIIGSPRELFCAVLNKRALANCQFHSNFLFNFRFQFASNESWARLPKSIWCQQQKGVTFCRFSRSSSSTSRKKKTKTNWAEIVFFTLELQINPKTDKKKLIFQSNFPFQLWHSICRNQW